MKGELTGSGEKEVTYGGSAGRMGNRIATTSGRNGRMSARTNRYKAQEKVAGQESLPGISVIVFFKNGFDKMNVIII